MDRPIASCRRIDHLKALAYDLGFTSEDARQFGKLTKTATWEALLELYSVDGETPDTMLDNSVDSVRQSVDSVDAEPRDTALDTLLDNSVDSVRQSVDSVDAEPRDTALDTLLDKPLDTVRQSVDIRNNSTFLDWVDVGQLIALTLTSVGVFVLAMNLWRQVNPLNLFPPVKVNIQIGAKL